MKIRIGFAIFLSLFFLLSCETGQKNDQKETPPEPVQTKFTLKDFLTSNKFLDKKVDSIFKTLSSKQKVSQLIIASVGDKKTDNFKQVEKLVKNKIIGGVAMFRDAKDTIKRRIKILNNENTNIPLLFSIDGEPGLINRRLKSNIVSIKNTSDLKTTTQVKNIAEKITNTLVDIGIYQNYAPVYDLSYNKAIINKRSFGNKPETIKKLGKAFINETQKKIVATVKHFPGHGNVKGDSHKQLVYIDGKLKERELFQSAIDDGVYAVMVGHIAIKNNKKYNTNGLPATLSKNIVTDLLKNEMKFKGLVVTDAFTMKAVNDIPNAGIKAIEAGCDQILMPENPETFFNSVLKKYKTDKQFAKTVDNATKKNIRLKICLGFFDHPKKQKKSQSKAKTYTFKGHVDKYPVKMTLHIVGNSVTGSYTYTNNNITLRLGGSIKANRLVLFERNKANQKTGKFIGKMENNTFSGVWQNLKTKKQLNFSLKSS